jgi:predicted MFS family arabinose efflux permease
MVDKAGYNIAFLFLATVALAAFMLFWIAVPETGKGNKSMDSQFDEPKHQRMGPLILSGSSAPAE